MDHHKSVFFDKWIIKKAGGFAAPAPPTSQVAALQIRLSFSAEKLPKVLFFTVHRCPPGTRQRIQRIQRIERKRCQEPRIRPSLSRAGVFGWREFSTNSLKIFEFWIDTATFEKPVLNHLWRKQIWAFWPILSEKIGFGKTDFGKFGFGKTTLGKKTWPWQ